MITKAHYLAWTIAALSGGALACESTAEGAPVPAPAREVVYTPDIGEAVEYFRHNGNDCYVYRAHAIACVKGTP